MALKMRPGRMSDEPGVGDRVRLTVAGRACEMVQEGLVLEPVAADCITIKLVNGYNVTHPLTDIESVLLLDSAAESSSAGGSAEAAAGEETPQPDQQTGLPLVVLLHTGGTIASRVDYATGAVTARFEPEEIIDAVPELRRIACIEAVKLGNMWSDDMRPRHWNRILEASAEAFAGGAVGVVITHGTDTMHLTAAAMAFGWAGSGGRPPGRVVLSGAQRSSDRGSTDAAENLIAAVHWAARGPTPSGHRDAAVIVMHATASDGVCAVIAGCAARKSHSSRRDAFESIDQPPIATIAIEAGGCSISMSENAAGASEPAADRPLVSQPTLYSEQTAIAEFVANGHMQPRFVAAAIGAGADALLIHGTGLGHLPLDDPAGDSPENTELAALFRDYCAGGGIAVVSTQCISGPVNMDVYAKGRDQQQLGLIGHGASAPPAIALVKLHHLLSRGLDAAGIQAVWASDLVGENPLSIRE